MSHPTQQSARNGLGIAALVLGIIGTVSGLIPLFFWLAGILGLIALILGLVGRGRAKRGEATNKGVALTGTLLGLAALILSVVGAVITYKAVDEAVTEINKELSKTAPSQAAPSQAAGDKNDGTGTSATPGATEIPKLLEADDTLVYDDNLEITVSGVTPFEPSDIAAGHTEGNKAYKVTVVIENKSKEKFDTALFTMDGRAGKDGVTAEEIYDEGTGDGFSGAIAPGKKATAVFAFDAPADAKTLTVEVSPGLEHEAQQWELKL
ncbi:DUF4190 domain-containing protein [Streptomyces sp. TRM64462]|uniref:DUF4190 domain-containing protein n=1 Tax=Streptomyces sp. TRM64462 TaxID=2741726 RepID=UPI001586C344|nr:DUF4190 domain-containing protein [Streptomyces sp. TRM64462]